MNGNEKLAQAIRVFPLSIAFLFSTILLLYTFFHYQEKVNSLTTSFQQDFFKEQKRKVLSRAMHLEMHSKYQAENLYQTIAERVGGRLSVARSIVENTYNANREKPPAEIVSRIADVFRNLHYQSGNEYFFLCMTTDGGTLMHPLQKCEGLAIWNGGLPLMYEEGTYGEQYHNKYGLKEWYYSKPGEHGFSKKMGNVFWFTPCNMLIGTGDYEDNAKAMLEEEFLRWIKDVYSQDFATVVVFDKNGIVLFNKGRGLKQGQSVSAAGWKIKGKPISYSLLQKSGEESGFFALSDKDGASVENFYLQILPEREWMVATRVDLEKAASRLHNKLTIINQQNIINLFLLLLSCVVLVGLVSWGTLLVSRRVNHTLSGKLMHNALTGLPNRSSFILQADAMLDRGELAAVINLDIDNFSTISEQYPREAGNLLLRQISERLCSIAPSSQLCHVEGDEFLLFFTKGKRQNAGCAAPCGAMEKINELRSLFAQPFFLEDSQLEVSFSSGCSEKLGSDTSVEDLIYRASVALFRAKEHGRDSHSCYTALQKQIERDRILADALEQAILKKEITIVYQPILLEGSNKVLRLEALSRWIHPELGRVGPKEFVAIAEKNGFILKLGRFLVEKVCCDLLELEEKNGETPVVSINISSRQLLNSGFIESVTSTLDRIGIPRNRLKLEMKETLLASDVEVVLPVMERLRREGLEVSLDDFGTGASSLSYINQIPVTELKIDKIFIAGLPDDAQSVALVRSIIAVAAANNFQVVAEGVESQVQYDWLIGEGCRMMQGYFLVEPLTTDDLLRWYKGYAGGRTV